MSSGLTDGHALHPFVLANSPQPSMFSARPEDPGCISSADYTALVTLRVFYSYPKQSIRQLTRQPWKHPLRTHSTVHGAAAAESRAAPSTRLPRQSHALQIWARLCSILGAFVR